mgnify:CR=1 FL=1
MKKLSLPALAFTAFTFVSNAQTNTAAAAASTAVKPTLTKEDKAKLKEQQEKELSESLTTVGLTDKQWKQVKEALDNASKNNSELKNNTALTGEQRTEEKKKRKRSAKKRMHTWKKLWVKRNTINGTNYASSKKTRLHRQETNSFKYEKPTVVGFFIFVTNEATWFKRKTYWWSVAVQAKAQPMKG